MKRPSKKDVNLLMVDVRYPQKDGRRHSSSRKIDRRNIVWGGSVILVTVLIAIFVLDLGGGARQSERAASDGFRGRLKRREEILGISRE